ncbi:MAG: cob(I)yrinic acid a,c-diamide adenosyltransferase [Phycisphaerae bacterium]|nr:cob(I)yrinic acid a,c-diamide adenosyltransferase [Phycisphaerae bacterium]
MKIYTKTGDGGETSLADGVRVAKHDPRVGAYGCVDELNAAIGWATVPCHTNRLAAELRQIQDDLFVVGAELATGNNAAPPISLSSKTVERLEKQLDHVWEQVPELSNFVLPGGGELAARLHLARTVCRRAERAVVELSKNESVGEQVIRYLNRLGDLLFAYARFANKLDGIEDVVWVPPEKNV